MNRRVEGSGSVAERVVVSAEQTLGLNPWAEAEVAAISSIDAMRLAIRLERDFQISIADDELRLEHFQSLDGVVALVGRHQ